MIHYTIIDEEGDTICRIECAQLSLNDVCHAVVQDVKSIPADLLGKWREIEILANDLVIGRAAELLEEIDAMGLRLLEANLGIRDVQLMRNDKLTFTPVLMA